MPALGIACSGATYIPNTTLVYMQHKCPQFQPGWPLPVNRAKEEEEASEDDSASDDSASEDAAGEEVASEGEE